jgi:signal transduction histidine kinase
LTLRVVTVALLCFVMAAAITLVGTYRDVRRANESLAEIVVRQLQMQLFRIDSYIDVPARFPDWEPVTAGVQTAGQCLQYVKEDGRVGRSSCIGFNTRSGGAPAWFSSLFGWLVGPPGDVSRPISYRGKAHGTLVVTTEKPVVLAAIWNDVSGLLGLTALVIGAICLLQFVAISRALRPTKEILTGLDTLARGDLSCRLPSFRLVELQRISDVFNRLAANLELTTREKTALAAKLVDNQEQERRHLARELHDELAQNLSAMTAIAASIKATAATECTVLLPEATKLAEASMAIMKSLQTTLRTLRPPEIDDLGLAASLSALAMEHERRAGGGLRISVEIDGDLQALPPTAASHVYRIVQEGLTNISKHAGATRARLVLGIGVGAGEEETLRGPWLDLMIEDDGCGANGNKEGNGLGLIGMRERVMALGGQLDARSGAERGFKLHTRIPFAAPRGSLQ